MTGQKIKDILRSEGITIADVARMLGHNGDQRLHSALKSEDVKSGLIEDIARVTNKSVCYFYEGSGNTVAKDHGIAVSGDSNQINALRTTPPAPRLLQALLTAPPLRMARSITSVSAAQPFCFRCTPASPHAGPSCAAGLVL